MKRHLQNTPEKEADMCENKPVQMKRELCKRLTHMQRDQSKRFTNMEKTSYPKPITQKRNTHKSRKNNYTQKNETNGSLTPNHMGVIWGPQSYRGHMGAPTYGGHMVGSEEEIPHMIGGPADRRKRYPSEEEIGIKIITAV